MVHAHALLRARIVSASLPDDIHVVELEGREAISELFSFTLTLRVPASSAVDAEKVIGSRATIVFEEHVGGKAKTLRQIHGLIWRCQDLLRAGDARAYRVQVVPRLWLSTLVETLDIFQDQTVPDIVQQKLGQLHLSTPDDQQLRLQSTYRKGEFTVQYKETDLAFLSRLTEHLGISFVFEHGDEVDKVMLVDDAAGFPALPEPIAYASGHDLGGVFDLIAESQIVPSNFFMRDYNYRNPGVDLMAEDGFEGFGGGVVEYGGHFKDPGEGKWLAGVRRQEKECRRRIYRGEAADPRLSAGHRTTIAGHPHGDIEVLPFVVEHHLTQTDFMARPDEAAPTYRCRFQATDAALTYRPERNTPKPRITGMVTGIVDGTGSDDYADVDEDGRYRVRFMFDTSGAGEGKASRPVRMMQPHAGGGFGMHFPLRRGTEVLITFIDGDPDRPIICGTVPNPQTPSPVAAGNNRRNIIRTGGNNEINIDDTEGSERIKLTTPHQNTVFQLGAPNFGESGAALATVGSYTRIASAVSSIGTTLSGTVSSIASLKSSRVLMSRAKEPTPLENWLTKVSILSHFFGLIAAIKATHTSVLNAIEKAGNEDATNKAKEADRYCADCRAGIQSAKSLLPSLRLETWELANDLIVSIEEQQKTFTEATRVRHKRDQSLEAGVGKWTDPNIHHHKNSARIEFKNGKAQFLGSRSEEFDKLWELYEKQTSVSEELRSELKKDNICTPQMAEFLKLLAPCSAEATANRESNAAVSAYHETRAEHSDSHGISQWFETLVGKDEVGRTGIAATGIGTAMMTLCHGLVVGKQLYSHLTALRVASETLSSLAKLRHRSRIAHCRTQTALFACNESELAPHLFPHVDEPLQCLSSERSTEISGDRTLLAWSPSTTIYAPKKIDIPANESFNSLSLRNRWRALYGRKTEEAEAKTEEEKAAGTLHLSSDKQTTLTSLGSVYIACLESISHQARRLDTYVGDHQSRKSKTADSCEDLGVDLRRAVSASVVMAPQVALFAAEPDINEDDHTKFERGTRLSLTGGANNEEPGKFKLATATAGLWANGDTTAFLRDLPKEKLKGPEISDPQAAAGVWLGAGSIRLGTFSDAAKGKLAEDHASIVLGLTEDGEDGEVEEFQILCPNGPGKLYAKEELSLLSDGPGKLFSKEQLSVLSDVSVTIGKASATSQDLSAIVKVDGDQVEIDAPKRICIG